jgi:hypothetical protein
MQLILLIGDEAGGTSIDMKECIDASASCARRTSINAGDDFCRKGTIRREKKEWMYERIREKLNRAHSGRHLAFENVGEPR